MYQRWVRECQVRTVQVPALGQGVSREDGTGTSAWPALGQVRTVPGPAPGHWSGACNVDNKSYFELVELAEIRRP